MYPLQDNKMGHKETQVRTFKIFRGRSGSEIRLNSTGSQMRTFKQGARLKFKRRVEWNCSNTETTKMIRHEQCNVEETF